MNQTTDSSKAKKPKSKLLQRIQGEFPETLDDVLAKLEKLLEPLLDKVLKENRGEDKRDSIQ